MSDVAGLAVDDHRRAGRQTPADVVQADDRRYAERPRQDRGVIGAAAGVGGESANARPVELRDHRRRELVGDEHARRVEILQQIARTCPCSSLQVHAQPPGDVVQVALSLVQVGIVDVVEDGRQLVERALHRPLRVDPLIADDDRGAADEHRIVEHQELGVEDRRQVRALELGDAPPDLFELLVATAAAPARARTAHVPRDPARSETG